MRALANSTRGRRRTGPCCSITTSALASISLGNDHPPLTCSKRHPVDPQLGGNLVDGWAIDAGGLSPQNSARPARRPCRRPDSNRRPGRTGSHANRKPGMFVKTGMPAARAGPDHRLHRRQHGDVAADPDRLDTTADERGDRLAHAGRVVHIRLEQLDPQLAAHRPGDLGARFGIDLRRVPGDADARQLRCEPTGHAECLGDRLHRPHPHHVRRVLHGIVARDPHARGHRVAHHAEDVRNPGVAVGPRHRLKAGRRQCDDQVVPARDQLPGDRV